MSAGLFPLPVFLIAGPIMACTWGLMVAGLFHVVARGFGVWWIWLWPPTLLLIAAALVDSRPRAFADGASTFASIVTPLVIALAWGLTPTWWASRALRKNEALPFGRLYANVVIPVLVTTMALVIITYFGLRLDSDI